MLKKGLLALGLFVLLPSAALASPELMSLQPEYPSNFGITQLKPITIIEDSFVP
jgi:hypothetical protein